MRQEQHLGSEESYRLESQHNEHSDIDDYEECVEEDFLSMHVKAVEDNQETGSSIISEQSDTSLDEYAEHKGNNSVDISENVDNALDFENDEEETERVIYLREQAGLQELESIGGSLQQHYESQLHNEQYHEPSIKQEDSLEEHEIDEHEIDEHEIDEHETEEQEIDSYSSHEDSTDLPEIYEDYEESIIEDMEVCEHGGPEDFELDSEDNSEFEESEDDFELDSEEELEQYEEEIEQYEEDCYSEEYDYY